MEKLDIHREGDATITALLYAINELIDDNKKLWEAVNELKRKGMTVADLQNEAFNRKQSVLRT